MRKFVAAIGICAGAVAAPLVITTPPADAAVICWTNYNGNGWTDGCATVSLDCADMGMESGESDMDSSGRIACYDPLMAVPVDSGHLSQLASVGGNE